MTVRFERRGSVALITIDRPDRRNALDAATARELDARFDDFDHDPALRAAVLAGADGQFCAGADLKAIAEGEDARDRIAPERPGPMGPTRRTLSKPVIAAVEGHAVAGGLELACWCDLRVAGRSAVFGVYCRRFGVPLVDGGTLRLPRLIGHSRALDMILTGRGIEAPEALDFGLVNRLVDDGQAIAAACELAASLAEFPQRCLRNDRRAALEQWGLPEATALEVEARLGLDTLDSGEALDGARDFAGGSGRHGRRRDK
jgi:enoyl-CoA hydratase